MEHTNETEAIRNELHAIWEDNTDYVDLDDDGALVGRGTDFQGQRLTAEVIAARWDDLPGDNAAEKTRAAFWDQHTSASVWTETVG